METDNKKKTEESALLQKWLMRNRQAKSTQPTTNTGIPPRPQGETIPLSSGQLRLWFLQQLYPDNPFYHYAEAYRLRGALQEDHLLEAFRKVAQDHEILRTNFHTKDGLPFQVVGTSVQLQITTHDLTGKSEAEAEQVAVEAAQKPFNLNEGALTRISLIKLGAEDHLLVLTMHHMITDKWSMQVLRKAWAKAYQALTAGQALPVLSPKIQYGDYAYWQKNQPTHDKDLTYWKDKLGGDIPFLKLPMDHQRPARPSFRGAHLSQTFSRDLSDRLKTLSKEANTTPFVLLLAAFKVLLYRYTGQDDLLVGTPITDRDQVSLENLIGFFNNTVVLRSDLSDNPTFLELVDQMRGTTLEAFSHKNIPFETLVQALKPERYTSINPLFQVMFLYHKVAAEPSFSADLSLEHKPLDFGVAKFDLTLYISEETDHLSATFEYGMDLFGSETINRMQGHLLQLLEAIVENPRKQISTFPLLGMAERKQLLETWNDTAVTHPSANSIHELFEHQAQQQADHPALRAQGESLSYGELNRRADNIANHLRSQGVQAGTGVALCTERTPAMIVGILGILKAGAAYIPFDPKYPSDRIQFMLEDAQIDYVLTQQKHAELFADTPSQQLLFIAELETQQTAGAGLEPISRSQDHPAYIIYTSGSTGRPKGVPITHGNLLHSTFARFHYYQEAPKSFLLMSSFAFDSSVAGIFWTLCSGGTLVLPKDRIEQDMNELASLVAQEKVTHTLLLPSLYHLLLQHAPVAQLASLNTVMVAGEACSAALCRDHFNYLPQAGLYNEYGPSEATVWCTVHKMKAEDSQRSIPIGRPIANTQIYILDQQMRPTPIGVAGELCVGGAGVARGYFQREDLTASRFISHPFSDAAEDKIYRTGDLARYRMDGTIEFLGRVDQQVKIRGYRIELDEIKESLLQIEGVKDAIVIAQKEEDCNTNHCCEDEELEQLTAHLASLDPAEAQRLLQSVAKLSETELDFLLD